jgi:hypothetical protein
MAASSANLHEDSLSPATVDRHRAIVSLMEELGAFEWHAGRTGVRRAGRGLSRHRQPRGKD